MKFHLYFLFYFSFLLISCSEDEDILPAYTQDLADLQTNEKGYATTLTTDNGTVFSISNEVKGLHSDTTYRILAAYIPSENRAILNSYATILAPNVSKYKTEALSTDPLTVTSCWKGLDYINFRLAIKGSVEKSHYFGFHQTDLITNDNGSQTLCVLLLHNQNDDSLYYTRETYISLPLIPLRSLLTVGRDSIRITVQTFDEPFIRTFAF